MDFSNPKTTNLLVGIVGVAIVASIFASNRTTKAPGSPPHLSSEMTELRRQAAELKNVVDDHATTLRLLQIAQQQMKRRNVTATFNLSEEGFQHVDSEVGAFLVSIHDAKPYGDGTRLTVRVGNVTSADFSGATLSLKYGRKIPENEDGTINIEELEKPQYEAKSKEHKILERVRAASWNPVTVSLPGIKPDELGYIHIGITADQIYLSST
jgi:hypothetical protein